MWTAESRKVIRGAKEHIAAGLGAATDYVARYEDLQIWFNGLVLRTYKGEQGGNWLDIMDEEGYRWQFAHLQRYKADTGQKVFKGNIVAVTGNTGTITTGAHLHIQALKDGKRIDPEARIQQMLKPNETNMDRRDWVKMKYLAYGLAPVKADVDYWSGQSDDRIMNDLPHELCRQTDNDGTPSARFDYFNKMAKSFIGRDLTTKEQKDLSDQLQPLRFVTDYLLSKNK